MTFGPKWVIVFFEKAFFYVILTTEGRKNPGLVF